MTCLNCHTELTAGNYITATATIQGVSTTLTVCLRCQHGVVAHEQVAAPEPTPVAKPAPVRRAPRKRIAPVLSRNILDDDDDEKPVSRKLVEPDEEVTEPQQGEWDLK